MGRLIDETELEKYIMHDGCEKGCGYIDERDLKYIPTVEAIPKAQYDELKANITMMRLDYEARLKDDMVAMLEELKAEIEKHTMTSGVTNQGTWNECIACCSRVIQQKINALKEQEDEP